METSITFTRIEGIMIKIFCVEGTKGAGKTTTIQNLRNFFETKKLSVVVKAPFYDVRPELKKLTGFENTYPASLDPIAAPLCNDLLIKQITSDINNKKADEILIFDRGWLTGLTTLLGSVLPAEQKQKEMKRWESLMLPTIFLYTKPDNTLSVRKNELSFNVGLKDKKMVEHDFILRYNLIQKYKNCVLSQVETFPLADDKEIQQKILQNKLIEKVFYR